jgi:type IV secretion system protein VirB5
MKLKTLSAACLAGALLCPLTAYAGIPVMVDADPLRQIQYATDAQNWLKTVEQYKSA